MATIYKRKKVWYIDYRIDGKRVRRKIGPSKKVAEIELKNIEVKLSRGEVETIEKRKKLDEFIDEFNSLLNSKKSETKRRYSQVLSHFQEFLSEYPRSTLISQINCRTIESYKQCRLEHATPKTVHFEISVLNYFFNVAIKYNYLLKNPVSGVEKPKYKKKSSRFLSKEEIKLILANCGTRLYPILLTFLYTGIRKEELRNLEWNDIDFKNRVIRINVKDFWEPKNGLSRTIPIKAELFNVLRNLEKRSNWVFSTQSGSQVRHIRRDLVNICDRLDIKNVNLHTFRHTFASHLVMSGVDLPTVQKLLGHKDIKTTMIYAHLAPEHIIQAVNKLSF